MKKLMVSAGAALLALSLAGGEVSDRPMVWAHHVPWHTPLNTGLTATGYYNFPVMDSTGTDQKDWTREIARIWWLTAKARRRSLPKCSARCSRRRRGPTFRSGCASM